MENQFLNEHGSQDKEIEAILKVLFKKLKKVYFIERAFLFHFDHLKIR